MQSTLENNRTKFRSKIFSQFWEIVVFVGKRFFSPTYTRLFAQVHKYNYTYLHVGRRCNKNCVLYLYGLEMGQYIENIVDTSPISIYRYRSGDKWNIGNFSIFSRICSDFLTLI